MAEAGSDDSYPDEFAVLTAEDFVKIDAHIEKELAGFNTKANAAAPQITVDIEEDPTSNNPSEEEKEDGRKDTRSPFRRFRRKGRLSVSDLVQPSWCEVQFEYGLYQRRHSNIDKRPTSFTTKNGNEIVVKQKVAEKRERVLEKGTAVHKIIEKEIRPEEIIVQTTSREEKWALRLLDTISCLESLLEIGCAREIPVFGFYDGHVVLGVIDELVRKPIRHKRPLPSNTSTPRKPKRTRSTPSSPSLEVPISEFFDIPIRKAVEKKDDTSPPRSPSYTLSLIDTKTRNKPSLPTNNNTQTSKLQLMMYHRLLTDLISSKTPFDFDALWTSLRLDTTRVFSPTFVAETNLPGDGVHTLASLGQIWINTVPLLDIDGIDDTLQLIYRYTGKDRNKNKIRRVKTAPVTSSKADLATADALSTEDRDIAAAIEASLEDMKTVKASSSSKNLTQSDTGMIASSSKLEPVPSNQQPMGDQSSASGSGTAIIGVKTFSMDETFLDEYLSSVWSWWTGSRRPRGVDIKDVGRCQTCEYASGCEWRAEKAAELRLQREETVLIEGC